MTNALRALLIGAVAGTAVAAEGPSDDDTVYLFTSFEEPGDAGLRFLYSEDGYEWHRIPGAFLKPHVGQHKLMRDPSLLRGPDGTFHLVWTTGWRDDQGFGYAHSQDLVHWSEQRFIPAMQHEPTTVNVWAPELFYDADEERFIICWASTIPGRFPRHLESDDNNQRMYYTTTRDFQTFTPTELFFDPDFNVIDCVIVRDDDRYVLVLKENTRPMRALRVAFGDGPLGPWRDVSEPFTQNFTEGPSVLKLGDDWIIYYDAYREGKYGAAKTRDFRTFTDTTGQVSFPENHKHGTVLRVTRKDVEYLKRVASEMVPGLRQPFATPLPADEIATRLAKIDAVAQRGPFQPNWESIKERFETPTWYQDAKLGIFIHWGVYSVPAFGSEWYPRNMYREGSPEYEHHLAHHGPHTEFGYKDFIPQFKAERFDAAEWARLFREAGAKYVIPVAEHHDGFPMYDSDYTAWSAAKLGPRRDVLGELAAALESEGIVLGASSHRAENWFYYEYGMTIDSDVRNPAHAAFYGPANNKRTAESQSEPPDQTFLDDWLLRSCEIVDKYRPRVVYFDWWICQPVFQPYLQRFAAYYYNRGVEWGQPVAVNFKEWEGHSFPRGTGVLDMERGQMADIQPYFWQTCTSVSKNSWGYVANHQYKQAGDIIGDLIDIVSKNGTMLLNIGPRADGTIPEVEADMLREIGGWLRVNGEAIYGTRPWRVYGEGPTQVVAGPFADVKRAAFTGRDFRFTTKDGTLYAIALAWPDDGKLVVTSLAAEGVTGVRLLGHDGELEWRQTDEGLVVTLPPEPPCEHAVTLAITGVVEP